MKSVDVTAGTLEYREEGDPSGPPVVLLHGLLMNDAQWNLALPLLPPGFRYLLPVLPMGGHRIPMREDADLTLPGMVGLLGDFLDALDLTDVTLVVSDWGGALFLTDIGRDKRVARLVICPSEAFDNFPPGFPGKVAWLASRNTLTVVVGHAPAEDRLAAAAVADVRPDGEKACAARYCRRMAGGRAGRQADPAGPRQILPHQVRRRRPDPGHQPAGGFRRPSRWCCGAATPSCRTSHGERLAALLPKGDLRQVDDAYVLVMTDQPEQTARAIGEFLTR